MCPMCDGTMGPWGWAIMLLFGLFWIAVIAGVGWLLYRFARGRGWIGTRAAQPDADGVLRERYARGEIDRATYERMREELGPEGPA